MRLRLTAACLFVATPAHAEPDVDPRPDLVEEGVELGQLEHETSAGYVASASLAGDGGGTAYALASLGGDVAYTASFGRERSQYEITIDAGATVSRMEGTVDATGASTSLHLALGPASVPMGNKDLMHAAPFPLTFELDHLGELAALPRISDRPDVLRAPYLSQTFALATRAYMMEYAEDGDDERPGMEDVHIDRETGGLELFPARAELRLTGQDGSRLETIGGGGLLAVTTHVPVVATVDCVFVEHRALQLADDRYGTTDTLWLLRGGLANPATGTAYEISFGFVLDQHAPAARPRERDHTGKAPVVGAIGLFSEPSRTTGSGVLYRHDAYVTMAGEPAFEDRMFVEGWWHPDATRLSARLFAARTKREQPAGADVTWTGGVELDARREVGRLAVGLHAEGGQSYYATLDGGAPTVSFGARAALTVSRSARWVRGTR